MTEDIISCNSQQNITEVPKVDTAMASLAEDEVVPLEMEFLDPTDRKMEAPLRRGFEASLATSEKSLTATCFMRATVSWLGTLKDINHPDFSAILKKISLATAFVANASMNAMRFFSQAMVPSSVARQLVCLGLWKVDAHSKQSCVPLS